MSMRRWARVGLALLLACTALLPGLVRPPEARAAGLDYVAGFLGDGTADIAGTVVDSAGNVYISGSFFHTVDFDPGPGALNLTSAGTSDLFIVKLDRAGNLVWARTIGGSGDDGISGPALDGSGNLYFWGAFQGNVDVDPGPGGLILTADSSGSGRFLLKLRADGTLVWGKQDTLAATSSNLEFSALRVDAAGNIYRVGSLFRTADADPGPGVVSLTSAGDGDAVIVKLDTNGDF